MRIKLLLIVLACMAYTFLPAQRIEPCGFDQLLQAEDLAEAERHIKQGVEELRTGARNADSLRAIPVVVHVVYFSSTENISEEQIQSQIRILNEDYGKMPGTPGDGAGVDTGIRFFLANLDPDGNCTNGIVRLKSEELADHQPYERPLLRQLSFWDNTRYLNIYIVQDITGSILGYSSFPGGPADEDGIVAVHDEFGNIGTASGSMGRTVTHEIGHWLGLYHTFHNGCGEDVCDDGDFVCDTPPALNPHYVCSGTNTCSNDDPDLPDQEENYMDYTPEDCKNRFTEGQRMRMQASLNTLRDYIWSAENLLSTGYDSVFTPPAVCPVHADFVTLTRDICVNNSVTFSDRSLNEATFWHWYFPGAIPNQSFLQNPKVFYPEEGTFPVSLVVENANGMDSFGIEEYITVSTPGTGDPLSYQADFDGGMDLPAGMTIYNPDGEITWEVNSEASVSGNNSIRIDNLSSTNYGTIDELILPYLDLTSSSPDSSVYLSFSYAYAKSVQTFTDELLVLLSTDCGQNFTQILYKAHADLTTADPQTTPFIPTEDQWDLAYVNLDNFRIHDNVLIKFVNVTDGGNYLYLDDFYLGDGSDLNVATRPEPGIAGQFSFYPNPVAGQLNIAFSLAASDDLQVEVLNAQGLLVRRGSRAYFAKGDHQMTVNTTGLAAGVYWVNVKGNGGNLVRRIVVEP